MPKHAYLSASASHRWLACPPSAKLCANIPDQASEYAQQGTDCHELCAYLVEKALGREVIDPTENLTYYDAEMQNCAEEYRNYVLEQIEAAKEYKTRKHQHLHHQQRQPSEMGQRSSGTYCPACICRRRRIQSR